MKSCLRGEIWASKQAGVKAVSHESTEPLCNVGDLVEKSGGLDTRELQLSLEAVFATRKDLPSARGERGKVCEFVWVVSIENEGIAN